MIPVRPGGSAVLVPSLQTASWWPLQPGLCCAQVLHAHLRERCDSTCLHQDKMPPWYRLEVLSFFLFSFLSFFSPCILLLLRGHKMTGACHWLHSSEIHEPRGVQHCSSLLLALEQTAAKLGSHGQAPAASMLCCSSVEAGLKGQRDPGLLQVFPRTQNRHSNQIITGNHKEEGSVLVCSSLPHGRLLAVASEGSGGSWWHLSSRCPFTSVSHLSWSGTSESNEKERGFSPWELYPLIMALKSLLLITYSFQFFPRHKK